jgi:hypothetical protein
MYSLNNISLDTYGHIPGRQSGSNLALSGFLNMPSRIGETGFDWAGKPGIEPYVDAGEIFFGGRDLNLVGYIKGNDRSDCEYKRKGLVGLVDSFQDLVTLASKWGSYQVKVNGPMQGEYLNENYLKIEIPFREPVVDMTGTIPAGESAEFGIDRVSFKSLGGTALELSGDRRNRTAPKSETVTAYGREGYAITNTVAPELNLRIYIKQPNYATFRQKINSLQALLAAPGMRQLTFQNDTIRSFYVKDGFTVDTVYSKPDFFAGIVNIKLIQAGVPTTLAYLTINGNHVTINGDNIQLRVPIL